MSVDQTLSCRDCGVTFLWTIGEQEFFASHGFAHAPTRCPNCRRARRTSLSNGAGDTPAGDTARRNRPLFSVPCHNCGGEALVPFQPRLDKPVDCNACFQVQRAAEPPAYAGY